MLVAELLGNPHHRPCVQTGRVGQQLAQVVVIGASELVLDHDPRLVVATAVQPSAENVGAETADRLLGSMWFQREPERLTQARQVLGLRQPRREMLCLVRPNRPQIQRIQGLRFLCQARLRPPNVPRIVGK